MMRIHGDQEGQDQGLEKGEAQQTELDLPPEEGRGAPSQAGRLRGRREGQGEWPKESRQNEQGRSSGESRQARLGPKDGGAGRTGAPQGEAKERGAQGDPASHRDS